MDPVAIAMCFNDRFCPCAAVTITSLPAHVSEDCRCDIYITQSDRSASHCRRLTGRNTPR